MDAPRIAGDQLAVNEELNFNTALARATCCHSVCMGRAFSSHGEQPKTRQGAARRIKVEGRDECADSVPLAAMPPAGTRYYHGRSSGCRQGKSGCSPREAAVVDGIWRPQHFHTARLNHRRFGRCTDMLNVCAGWNETTSTCLRTRVIQHAKA